MRKKSVVLLSFLLLFLSTPTASYPDRQNPSAETLIRDGPDERNSSRWPPCDNTARSQNLTFLDVSDIHAHYNPDVSGSSPLARIRGYYERTKRTNPFTLLTNAGDDYEKGSIAEVLSRGRATREVVEAMGYDVRAIGNHDFAWGLKELLAFSRDPSAIVLASNIQMVGGQSGSQPGWTDYAALTLGCVRIGVFGLVSKPWDEKGKQYDGSYYPQLRSDFRFVQTARKIIARHREDADLLVLVSHLGAHEDTRLAEQTEGIDLILGGHSHTLHRPPEAPGPSSAGVFRPGDRCLSPGAGSGAVGGGGGPWPCQYACRTLPRWHSVCRRRIQSAGARPETRPDWDAEG
jgi:2',3'-cyclic-nucleotide 2'-phosphodiesterase (5'-nucleotidase family)